MRKIAIQAVILYCILCAVSGYGQDLKISDFRLSRYKVFRTSLSADLYKSYYNDDVSYNIGLGPLYKSMSDTSEFTLNGYLLAGRSSYMASCEFRAGVDLRHYLSDIFIHGLSTIGSSNYYYFDREPAYWDTYGSGDLEVGCGVGHMREGMYASTALYINEILKKEGIINDNLSKTSILAIAQLIAKKQYFLIEHDRYEKFMFTKMQDIIEADPAFEKIVSAYAWFRIFDIIDDIYPNGWYNDVVFWSRQFGSRLSFDFLATNIKDYSERYNDYRMRNFPIFDSVYYIPGVRVKYDYGNPLSLKSHIMFSTSYKIEWYDSVSRHNISTDFTYSYGIIDNILLEGALNAYYYHIFSSDTTPLGVFNGFPEVRLSYYIEDRIKIGLEVGFYTQIKVEYDDQYDFIFENGIRFEVNTRWYIFR